MPKKEMPGSAPELKVIPQGADVVFKWLTVMNSASESPFVNSENAGKPELILTAFDVRNSLLHGVVSKISFVPSKSYQIITGFMSTPENLLGVFSHEGFKKPLSKDCLPDIKILRDVLQRKLKGKGFSLTLNNNGDDENILRIANTSDNKSFELELITGPMKAQAYLLNFKDKIGTDQKTFEEQYARYALLVKNIINSIYQARGQVAPNKTLPFAPPEDTATGIKKLETILGLAKRQVNELGGNDKDLEAEIESKIVYERPAETFDDVGGQERAKEELKTLALSLLHPEAFQEEGTYPPRRVLLYGPPGTGKTLLARALANCANAGLLVVEVADIVHHYYGRSERYVQKMFEVARQRTPVILFFDELDALATERQHADQVISKIVNVLLTNFDGMRNRDEQLMVVATTNRLDVIDRALLRPGRFDSLIEVKLPDDKDRETIFQIHIRKAMERATRGKQLFDTSLDISSLVARTQGFSGDDIRELIKRALNVRVRQKLQGLEVHPTTTEDLLRQVDLYETVRIEKQKRAAGFHPF